MTTALASAIAHAVVILREYARDLHASGDHLRRAEVAHAADALDPRNQPSAKPKKEHSA